MLEYESTPGVKKEWPRAKKGLVEKDMKSKWAAKASCLIGLKFLTIMTSLQNIVISGAQDLLMLMGSKVLIKMIRPQNIKMKEQCFVAWSSLSKILIPSTSGDLDHPK